MVNKTALLELLLAGFFAIACVRAHGRIDHSKKMKLGEIFRLTGRIERLRRSRWQWFSIVLVMLVLRLQHQLPPAIEIMVAFLFVVFLVLPVQALVIRAR